METMKTCLNCGEDFLPARTDAKFCSNNCKQQAYLKRKDGLDIRKSILTPVINDDYVTDSVTDTNRKMTDNLRIESKKTLIYSESLTDNSLNLETEEESMTVKGISIPANSSLKFMYSKEELTKMRIEEDKDGSLTFTSLELAKIREPKYSGYDRTKVNVTNKHLEEWIQRLLVMETKECVHKEELKDLLKDIEVFIQCSDFRYLPSQYPHKLFVQLELREKIEKAVQLIKSERLKSIKLTIEDEFRRRIRNVLYQLK